MTSSVSKSIRQTISEFKSREPFTPASFAGLGSRAAIDPRLGMAHYPAGMRFLKADGLAALLEFPPDMARIDADVNKLNNQALVRYFDEEWSEYVR